MAITGHKKLYNWQQKTQKLELWDTMGLTDLVGRHI